LVREGQGGKGNSKKENKTKSFSLICPASIDDLETEGDKNDYLVLQKDNVLEELKKKTPKGGSLKEKMAGKQGEKQEADFL